MSKDVFNLRAFLMKGAHLTVVTGVSSLLSIAAVLSVYKLLDVNDVALFFATLSVLMVVNRVIVVNPWQTIIKYEGPEGRAPYEQCFSLDVISTLAACAVLIVAINWFSHDTDLVYGALLTVILVAKSTGVFVGGLRLYGYFNSVEYIKLLSEVVKFGLLGVIYYLGAASINTVAAVFAVAEVVKFTLIALLWALVKTRNKVRLDVGQFFRIRKDVIRYSLYANFNGSLVGSIKLGDVALLAAFADDAAVALYKLIRVVSSAMGLITDPLQVLIFPDLVKRIRDDSIEGVKVVLQRFHLILAAGSSIVIAVTLVVWPFITHFFLGYIEYIELVYVSIMLLAVLLQINFFYLQPLLMAANKVSEIFIINLKSVTVYVATFGLAQFYSPIIAILVAYLLFSCYAVYSRWKLVRKSDI